MFGVFVLGIFMIAMLGGLVSAREGGAFEPVQDAVVSVYKTIEPVLEFAIGTTEGAPELFFAKVCGKAKAPGPFEKRNECYFRRIFNGSGIFNGKWL